MSDFDNLYPKGESPWGRMQAQNLALATQNENLMRRDIDVFQNEVGQWAEKTFSKQPDTQGLVAIAMHLEEELHELVCALHDVRYDKRMLNAADKAAAKMGILLLNYCNLRGISLMDIMQRKENETRTWLAPDANGVCRHDKTGETLGE